MSKTLFSPVPGQPWKEVFSFHDRDTLLLVAKHDQLISRFDIKDLSGFCRNNDLPFLSNCHNAKYVLTFWWNSKPEKIIALIFNKVIQCHTKYFCQLPASYNVG